MADGTAVCKNQVPGFEPPPPPPELPPTVDVSQGDGGDAGSYFTASNEDGDRFRVRASSARGIDATLIVATPLADVDATLDRLLLIMLLVTSACWPRSPRSASGSSASVSSR